MSDSLLQASPTATLRVNLRSGETRSYDLLSEEGLEAWARDRVQASFQREIAAVCAYNGTSQHCIPAPKSFWAFAFDAWVHQDPRSGNRTVRVSLTADGVKIVLACNSSHHRVSVEKIGSLRYSPDGVLPVRRLPR